MGSRHRLDRVTRMPSVGLPPRREIEQADIPDGNLAGDPVVAEVDAEPYILNDGLREAVDVAIALGRPMLLQGDPGCGKTRLAHHVAYALALPLETAYVKSTSRAQDLLYTFDAVGRLYDVELRARAAPTGRPGAAEAGDYVRLGPFGRAIARARAGRRSVVLIDEIDKADIDFPNDLLRELDRMEFTIAETDEHLASPPDRPELRPIVFVTHNEERPLPPAFLRRCVYHWLTFPDDDDFLTRVLELHGVEDGELAARAAEVVRLLRTSDLSRPPGISELLDWALVLESRGVRAGGVDALPALGALVKSPLDQERASRIVRS